MSDINKVAPSPDYPPEEGCYLRGNDYSPVAVVVLLNRRREETPPELEALVRAAVESGAALTGTLQTENIGIEKIVCNIVANPNIRYILLCGPESAGHLTGEALAALIDNGIDEKQRIVGTDAPTPYLFNIPREFVERFRKQITLINCVNEGTPDLIRDVVCACYQETPTSFRDYRLWDVGSYPEPALSGKITWRVTRPEQQPKDEEERKQVEQLHDRMEWIKRRVLEKRQREKVEKKESEP